MLSKSALGHGFILAVVNFGSVYAGFLAYHLAPWDAQLAIQLPVALLINTIVFAGWMTLAQRGPRRRWALREPVELIGVGAAALLWAPLIFIPLHYLATGYLTSAGNLIAGAVYQTGANLLVLPICGRLAAGLSYGRD
jgi:hypothetical protein